LCVTAAVVWWLPRKRGTNGLYAECGFENSGLGIIFAAVLASIAGAFPLIIRLSMLTVTAWLRRRRST
jgi:hypothetical protein